MAATGPAGSEAGIVYFSSVPSSKTTERWGCKRGHYSGFRHYRQRLGRPPARGPRGSALDEARASPPAGRRRAHTAEMTATASAPASMTSAALAAVMPPIATKGTGISGRSFRTEQSGPTSWKPGLAPGREDAADGDVVGAIREGLPGLRRVVGRDAEHHAGREDAARGRRREDRPGRRGARRRSTARARSARSLTMKRAPAGRQRPRRARATRAELGHGRGLVPELDEAAPAREHRVEQRRERAAARDLPVEDHVERRRAAARDAGARGDCSNRGMANSPARNVGIGEELQVKGDGGLDPLDHGLGERAVHPRDGLRAVARHAR